MLTPAEKDLQARVFELWDRALQGDVTLKELRNFQAIANVFDTLAQAEERVARTELIQVRTHGELERLQLKPLPTGDEPPLLLGCDP